MMLKNSIACDVWDSASQDTSVGTASNQHQDRYEQVCYIEPFPTKLGTCLAEMEQLHEAHARFGPQGLQIISLSADREKEIVEAWRNGAWKMPWSHAMAINSKGDLLKIHKVIYFPTNFLVGPDGRVLATGTETVGDQLLSTLEKHLTG